MSSVPKRKIFPQTPYWCFTLNNPGEDGIAFDPKIVQYLCYQLEEGASKTPHYQGFIQFVDKKTTMKRAKEFLGDRCHLEAMKAKDPMDAIRYTKKEEGRLDGPWEHGEFLHPRSRKRKRATLEAEYDDDPESFQLRDPDLAARIEAKRLKQEFIDHDEFDLDKMDRPWQVQLRKELEEVPDDRTIHWVYGPEGNEGKSTFVKCLMRKGWVMVNAGAAADMKYQYIQQGMTKNMVVDIPRKVQGVHYSAIYALVEEVKNRLITSTKYRPVQVVDVRRVHVVVMSNKKPDMEMLSRDRICLHDLSVSDVEKKDDKVVV